MMRLYRRFRIRNAFMEAREEMYEKMIEELDKENGGGKRTETLSALFVAWAERQSDTQPRTSRSRKTKRNKWLAAAYTSIAYKMNSEGRSLSDALLHLIPFEERMVIWGGEQKGELVESLHHVLRIKRTLEEMKANTRAALMQPIHGAANVFGTALLLGLWVWPDMMNSIPSEFWPGWTKPSIAFDLWFARNWPVLGIVAPLLYAYYYTLPRWTGQSRQIVDRVFPWATYREEQSNVLLTTLAGLLSNSKFTITHACEEIRAQASPYLRWHLNRITPQIEVLGDEALKAFDTGLISSAVMDRLEDAKRTRDLDRTIQHVGDRSLAAMVRISKRYAQYVSAIASFVFVILFLYSAAVQLMGTQNASQAYAAKLQRAR